jgi:hypothetical protein
MSYNSSTVFVSFLTLSKANEMILSIVNSELLSLNIALLEEIYNIRVLLSLEKYFIIFFFFFNSFQILLGPSSQMR